MEHKEPQEVMENTGSDVSHSVELPNDLSKTGTETLDARQQLVRPQRLRKKLWTF